ncbi:hypothetical protein AB3X52_04575 [Nocardioides sp. DS6]|uniref:HK97 family phage prohead protease n=1 Tax=Nocardioides eburneus TaxID=3231482 RepID=A0ABV3SWY7_9ACTN
MVLALTFAQPVNTPSTASHGPSTAHHTAPEEVRRGWPGGRRLTGLAVPYDRISTRTQYEDGEVFRYGAFAVDCEQFAAGELSIPLVVDHNDEDRIGWITEMHETPEGLEVEAWVGDPNELLTIRRNLSISFRDGAVRQGPEGVREVLAAHLSHVSLVRDSAYVDARIYDPPLAPAPELVPA